MNDEWLVDGSLVYRVDEEGRNCEEIYVSLVHGSRDYLWRYNTAKRLAVLLNELAAGRIVHLKYTESPTLKALDLFND
jgi:hypothetical protein